MQHQCTVTLHSNIFMLCLVLCNFSFSLSLADQTAFYCNLSLDPERCDYCTVIAPVEWAVVTDAAHSVRWTNGAQQVGITHQSHHRNPPELYLSPLPLLLILLPGDIVS